MLPCQPCYSMGHRGSTHLLINSKPNIAMWVGMGIIHFRWRLKVKRFYVTLSTMLFNVSQKFHIPAD